MTVQNALSRLGSRVAGTWLPGISSWVAALLAIAVAGCASMGGGISKDSPLEAKRAVVSERANARWSLLIKGDVDQAYVFMSTGSQAAYPLNLYKAKIKPAGSWRAAKIDSIDCEAELCKVKVILTYDHRLMKGVQVPLEESWIIERGTAWYVYQPQS